MRSSGALLHSTCLPLLSALLAATAGTAAAADVPITARKLVIVDKDVSTPEARLVFVAKDPAVSKGSGVDPADIEASMFVVWDGKGGIFEMPAGPDWILNKETVAKYLHPSAPTDGAVKVGLIKPGKLLKTVAKSLGDSQPVPLAQSPSGPVYVVETVDNGGEIVRHCTLFEGCTHVAIGGNGFKLLCFDGIGDPDCSGADFCLQTGSTDLCNGLDDDCDASSADGSEDPAIGAACDGGDADLCEEGTRLCSGGAPVCSDSSDDNAELCDGADNDCDGDTADGADEPLISTPTSCDSMSDADNCIEGSFTCAGASLVCSDPGDDDTTDDVGHCGGCDLPCEETNTSTTSCVASGCEPTCSFGYQNCDGDGRDGCEAARANSTTCLSPINLGEIDGDDAGIGTTVSGFGEAAYRVRMLENNAGDENAVGVLTLTNPPGVRFQLCAFCEACGAAMQKCIAPPAGSSDTMRLGRADDTFDADDVVLFMSISLISTSSQTACGNWTLNVHGDDGSDDCTCDPDHSTGPDCD